MDKKEQLNSIKNIAWELLKYPPEQLKKNGINPLNLVGANFAVDEIMETLGIDPRNEIRK